MTSFPHLPRCGFFAARRIAHGLLLVVLAGGAARADDWPQWRGKNRDGVWQESGLVEKFASDRLEPRWRVPIGSGYSGPTVAARRVYLTDRVVEPRQIERVHCFAADTGEPLWSHSYDCVYEGVGYVAGPRASVTIDDGRAYSLGTMGHLFCFDAATGDAQWQLDLQQKYALDPLPIWGLAAAPLVDGPRLILHIGAEAGCIVAFDKLSGAELWKALPGDRASYSAPIMIQQGGQPVLVCWTGDHVAGLNPADGSIHWKFEMKPTQMPIGIATPVVDGGRLFVSSFYDGSYMLKLASDAPKAEPLWRRLGPDEQQTESLHAMIGTPIVEGDFVYGVDSYGQLRCLDARTGERLWENLTAVPKARWSTIHMVKNGERVWMLNERGELLIGRLSPQGFEEISRAKLIDPTEEQLRQRGGVCWSHPAFAGRRVYARNDAELVCVDLAAEKLP